MKRKIIFLNLIIIFVLSLSSCNINKNIINDNEKEQPKEETKTEEKPWLSLKTVKGTEFKYNLTEDEFNNFSAEMERAKKYVDAEDHYDYFIDIYNKAENYYDEAVKASDALYLDYCLYGDLDYLDGYEVFDNIRIDILKWFNDVEHLAFNNSFKNRLWDNKTDDEILELIGTPLPEEYYNLSKELTSYQNDYYELDSSSYDYLEKVDKLYVSYVNASNKLSKYLNYDNYMDYMYEDTFLRDYKPSDTGDFFKYCINYLGNYYLPLIENRGNGSYELNSSEKRILNNFFDGNCFEENNFKTIENYKDSFGGIIKEAFENLFKENGYYFISYEKDGDDGAFQDTFDGIPYVFYGAYSHDYLTVIHEFGHYTYALKGLNYDIFDLCETHSQGNEFMFLNYYMNNNNFSDNLKEALMKRMLYNYIRIIVIASLVNEVEKNCYGSNDFKIGDLKKELTDIYNEYPLLKKIISFNGALDYIVEVTMDSPCYYISYATSAIGALNLNKIASEDYNKAKECYLKLIKHDGYDEYLDIYEYAGLYNPFNEETFKYLIN